MTRRHVLSTVNIFIHNDLENIANYYRNLIIERHGKPNKKGITFDCMSCLVFLAFSFEAYLNYFGLKLVAGWEEKRLERKEFNKKVNLIFDTLKISRDQENRPNRSIYDLVKFRNTIAHGKPNVEHRNGIVETLKHETNKTLELTAEWKTFCTQENTLMIYEDVKTVLKAMREASRIEPWEMLTSGISTSREILS